MAMIRFGQIGKLKKEKIDEYVELHANTWPGVLKTISECNLQNYSIFLHGDLVFSYFEYVGEDYDADMRKMGETAVQQRWWQYSKPCFLYHEDGVYYDELKEIFYLA